MTTIYKKYSRDRSRWVGEVIPGDAEEALHQACTKHLQQMRVRLAASLSPTELTAFVADDNFKVRYWATTFVNDPDHAPFYSLRSIPPTPMDTVKSWTYDQLVDATTDILGNFEP